MLTVMLLDQLRPTRTFQGGALLNVRPQVKSTRLELLLKINRMEFQFPYFDEHRILRAPPEYREGPRKHARRRRFYGATFKNKGGAEGVSRNWAQAFLWSGFVLLNEPR